MHVVAMQRFDSAQLVLLVALHRIVLLLIQQLQQTSVVAHSD